MDILCKVCDKDIIENESEYKNYIATLRKKDDKSIYKKYIIYNIILDEVDKIINDYVSTHNKKINIYFIYCEFDIQFDNNHSRYLPTVCVHNIEFEKIVQSLLYYIECPKINGFIFEIINQMTINTISDRCNMTHEYYMHPPMFPLETKLNIFFAKNPQLLDQNINHLFIRKHSHISFNI